MKSVTPESAASPFRAMDRLRHREFRLPWALVVVLAVGLVAAGQLAEDLVDTAPLQMLPPTFLGRRWTLVVAVLYMLVISRVLDRTVERSLPTLERVLRMDAATFRAYVARMRPPDAIVNVVLLAASALIATVLFVLLGLSLMTDDPVTNEQRYLPASAVGSALILAGYTIVGWSMLSLVYRAVRLGRALGELTREPLDVDVFDTTNLLSFGNIALATSLAPAGLIVILLLGLGQPTTWFSWAILLLTAVASLLALLLPLRGIHGQMSEAKAAVLADLNSRIAQVYGEVSHVSARDAQPMGLDIRTNTLLPLRRAVGEMTTWPFADTVAFGRAILIASAPLIYTVLSELIKVFWINPLSR